jgi:hypothetical protein
MAKKKKEEPEKVIETAADATVVEKKEEPEKVESFSKSDRIIIVSTGKGKSMNKEGREHEVSGSIANALIEKGLAKFKEIKIKSKN